MPRKLSVTKIVKFAAAHFLPEHSGKCQNLHGHEWRLEVTVTAHSPNVDKMVLDFSLLKEIIQKRVLSKLDHKLLNDIIYYPSAENLSDWIITELEEHLNTTDYKLTKLVLWESDNSFATLEFS